MADAEMVFPDKKIFLKPLLIIQLLIAIIGGIVATFAALLSVSHLCPPHFAQHFVYLSSTATLAIAALAVSIEEKEPALEHLLFKSQCLPAWRDFAACMAGLTPSSPIISSHHTTLFSSQLILQGKAITFPHTEEILDVSAPLGRHTP